MTAMKCCKLRSPPLLPLHQLAIPTCQYTKCLKSMPREVKKDWNDYGNRMELKTASDSGARRKGSFQHVAAKAHLERQMKPKEIASIKECELLSFEKTNAI